MSEGQSRGPAIDLYDATILSIRILFFVCLAASAAGLFYFSSLDRSDPIVYEEPVYIEEWEVTDPEGNVFISGESYRNSAGLKGTFTVVSTLPDIREDSDFCFIVGGDVAVYVGDELRRDFSESRDMVVPGGCVKRFYMLVPVSQADSGKEIKIVRLGTYRRGYVYQDTFVVGSKGVFPVLMSRYGLSMILALILMIFALVIVIISITMRLLYRHPIEMLYGALGIFVIAGWIITNSYLFPFVYGHYHLDGVINYLLCLMLPFSLVFYLNALQQGRYHRIMSGVLLIAAINLIGWPILHFTGAFSFSRALPLINAFLGVEILIVMGVLGVETIRGRVREYKYTATGFVGFLICGLSEIFVLNFFPVMHEEMPMLIGLAFMLTLSVIQQIDDLRKVSEERQKAVDLSEAKTRFLASMSHEIRTPINAILGMNEMILRENEDPVVDGYAKSVKTSGKMLLMLVNDVLDFSKIEAGKMEISEAEYRLSSLLRDIMPMLEERAAEKKLRFNTVILSDVPDRQISDEFRIRQILVNLINNAIKYTDTGSVTLMIGGDPSGEENFDLELRVKDTGRGIREEDQKHLFEAFTRADVKKNRNIEGTGLGLAIVKNILDSMGGKISVTSRYGEGSEFAIVLPVKTSGTEPLREDYMDSGEDKHVDRAGSAYQAPDAAVLAVDDNNANLRIVELFLKRVRIAPDLCDGGRAAFEKCREKKYDLILLDHMMPEPDGIETLHMIRSDDSSLNKDTPVIVLTANAVAGSRQRYMDEGFADYLTKPLDATLLEETIREYLPSGKIIAGESGPQMSAAGNASLRERLSSVEGLDYDTAIGFASNNEELLEEIILEIAGECEERVARIQSVLKEKDMDSYQREAHSLKSLMATIGLNDLSESARKLEKAAEDKDIIFIQAESWSLISRYQDTCLKLNSAVRQKT
ncbi:MAG: response regulator [Lachnospiraceae bacterium]|nr:response regulator [Lachnospiraceae bacterium]